MTPSHAVLGRCDRGAAGLIEGWGRAYERIAEACREQGTPEPTVESDGNGVRVQWTRVNPTSDADRIRARVEGQVQVTGQVMGQVDRLLMELAVGERKREELQAALGLAGRGNFRALYLAPALDAGLIEMTIPDKPNSRLQKYRTTAAGKTYLTTQKEPR